jgi:hypothetical protein
VLSWLLVLPPAGAGLPSRTPRAQARGPNLQHLVGSGSVEVGSTDIGGFHAAAQKNTFSTCTQPPDCVDPVGPAYGGHSDNDHEQLLGSRRSERVGMDDVKCLSPYCRQRRERNRRNGRRWDDRRLLCHRDPSKEGVGVSECGHECTRSNSHKPMGGVAAGVAAGNDLLVVVLQVTVSCPWCRSPAPSHRRHRCEPLLACCAGAGSSQRQDAVRRRVRCWAWRALHTSVVATVPTSRGTGMACAVQ